MDVGKAHIVIGSQRSLDDIQKGRRINEGEQEQRCSNLSESFSECHVNAMISSL